MKMSEMLAILGLIMASSMSSARAGEVRVDPDQTLLLLSTERSSTMADEIRQAAELGFRILVGSPTRSSEFAYLLERGDRTYPSDHYRLLATRRLGTMQRELNQNASEGYRLVPRSPLWPECDELMLVMEKTPREDASYDYLVLGTQRTSTLQKELSEAVASGYEVISMLGGRENVVILERAATG